MNWDERIQKAMDEGSFTEEDRKLARSYQTCAVGEAFGVDKMEEASEGTTYEHMKKTKNADALRDLGMQFHAAVVGNDVKNAQRIADEARRLAK